jgi:hypothetical protein
MSVAMELLSEAVESTDTRSRQEESTGGRQIEGEKVSQHGAVRTPRGSADLYGDRHPPARAWEAALGSLREEHNLHCADPVDSPARLASLAFPQNLYNFD